MGILSSETIAYKYFVWSYNSMWTSLMSGLATLHYSLLLLQRNQSDLAQFNFSQLITLRCPSFILNHCWLCSAMAVNILPCLCKNRFGLMFLDLLSRPSGSAGIMRVYQGAGLIWIEMLVPIVPVCFFWNQLFWKWESTEQVI